MRQETVFPTTFCFTILQSLSFSDFGTRSSRVRQYVDLPAVGGIDIAPIVMDDSVESSHSPSFTSTPAECANPAAQRRMRANRKTVCRTTFFMIDPPKWLLPATHPEKPTISLRGGIHVRHGLHCPPRRDM